MRTVILTTIAWMFIAAFGWPATASLISVGGGLDSRHKRELNPKRYSSVTAPALFVSYLQNSWEAKGELSYFSREQSYGNLRYELSHWELMAWGRYYWSKRSLWKTYAGLGAGLFRDSVAAGIGSPGSPHGGRLLSQYGITAGLRMQMPNSVFGEFGLQWLRPQARDYHPVWLINLRFLWRPF